eukprot:364643-Chlamydomonas_euryale.AAC.11
MRAGVPVLSPRAVRGAAARPLGPARCAPVNSTPSFADRRTIDSMDDSSLYDTSEVAETPHMRCFLRDARTRLDGAGRRRHSLKNAQRTERMAS